MPTVGESYNRPSVTSVGSGSPSSHSDYAKRVILILICRRYVAHASGGVSVQLDKRNRRIDHTLERWLSLFISQLCRHSIDY